MGTTRLRWASKSLRVEVGLPSRLVYHDLYLGGKALVERENVGFDLTKSYLCPSFVEGHTAKGVGLRVVDSHTGNHREDDFTPLETIRRFLGIIGSRSLSSSKGRPSSRRGGLRAGGEACGGEISTDLLRAFLNLGPAGNWLTLFNRSGPSVPKAVNKPITHIEEMDFRSFMMQGIDGEFHFEPDGGVGNDEGSSPSTRFVNNETLVIDAEPLTSVPHSQFTENTRDKDDAPLEKDKARKVPPKASKASGDPSDPLDVDSNPDIHEFPSAKELKDSADCHWVAPHLTPHLWKQHLKEISLEKLYDIHDNAYMRQVVLDNVMNKRTREFMSTQTKARASCDAIREREREKDKAYADLEVKCNDALQDLDKNPLVLDMHAEIEPCRDKFCNTPKITTHRNTT
ncbi:hypothetical protein Tco_0427306 [Tanacetum coccineum]